MQPEGYDRRGPASGRKDGDERKDPAREAQRDALIADISARLRHLFQHLTDAEFSRMASELADTKLRFADIDADAFLRPRHVPDVGGDER